MKLYVMRHGHSPSIADAGVRSDGERPLSEKGRADAGAQARKLADAGGKPSLILHSPLRRAVETAAAAAAVLNVKAEPFAPLSNELGPEDLARALGPRLSSELLIVGHQPQVGELTAWLCGQLFDFRPASVVALEVSGKLDARSSLLLWSEQP